MENIPIGNGVLIRSAADIGQLARERRKSQKLNQAHVAGVANTGNRFIVELEKGKPTLQLQKVIDVLALLGLDLIVRPRR